MIPFLEPAEPSGPSQEPVLKGDWINVSVAPTEGLGQGLVLGWNQMNQELISVMQIRKIKRIKGLMKNQKLMYIFISFWYSIMSEGEVRNLGKLEELIKLIKSKELIKIRN